jgi:alkylation response protein AidB-like acyl-CoA dehydrogenase
MAREWALAEVAPVIHGFDEAHEFPHEILKSLGKTGLLGALVPEEYGGAALDYVSYALAVEELNRVDASVGITMWAHNSLCTNHIALFGSKEQKAAYLPRLARGEALGAWGLTESGSGSDAAAMQSRAVPDGSRFVSLNGGKAFMLTNAGVAELTVVSSDRSGAPGQQGHLGLRARRACRVSAQGDPTRKLGLHASNTAELVFDSVAVPGANLLGGAQHGIRQHDAGARGRPHRRSHDGGRHRAGHARPGTRLHEAARRAFGEALAEFNGLQGMIADIRTEVEAAALTLRARLPRARGPAKTAASMAKLFASGRDEGGSFKGAQIHGGAGSLSRNSPSTASSATRS